MDNIQGVASSSELPIATPMNIPMMAETAERELYISATYHLIPLDSRTAKSPVKIKLQLSTPCMYGWHFRSIWI